MTDDQQHKSQAQTPEDDMESISSFEKINLHDNDASSLTREDDASTTAAATAPPKEQLIGPTRTDDGPAFSGDVNSNEGTDSLRNPAAMHSGVDPVMRELEEAATVAAVAAREAANMAQQKLTRGVAEARAFVSSLWSTFDDSTAAGPKESSSEEAVRLRLGLEPDEQILEVFRCKLLQVYQAANGLTPSKTIAFSGQLTIGTGSVCFDMDSAPTDGRPALRFPRKDLKSFRRSEGDANCIQLQLIDGREIVVGQFSFPRLEVESAVALLEELVGGRGGT